MLNVYASKIWCKWNCWHKYLKGWETFVLVTMLDTDNSWNLVLLEWKAIW